MKFLLTLALFFPLKASALAIYDQNVFDQLQGSWKPSFRKERLELMTRFVKERRPDIVVFEEARGDLPGSAKGGEDSADSLDIRKLYPHRKYEHEMKGEDGASYGYWMGSKRKPKKWITDGFSFPGGVPRRVLAAVWDKALGGKCLGVLGLHLSYQTSAVRQKEAEWLLTWLKDHEKDCPRWLVMGDFNADRDDAEMKLLFAGGLKPLSGARAPTVGPYNPIRRIYGADKPSLTIDWALGWKLEGEAEVVLNKADAEGRWVSDHAGLFIKLK